MGLCPRCANTGATRRPGELAKPCECAAEAAAQCRTNQRCAAWLLEVLARAGAVPAPPTPRQVFSRWFAERFGGDVAEPDLGQGGDWASQGTGRYPTGSCTR
jgi:hypothetical protein